MLTEKQKMLNGDLYIAADPELVEERLRTRSILGRLNDLMEVRQEVKIGILKELIPRQGKGLWIEPPFYCDYGTNIIAGDNVYFNFSCTILDVMQVSIGDNVFVGPNVQIYTAMHPLDWKERATGIEYAKPVKIGSDIWIGGGAIICPGVTIGSRTIIGAGSVVTRDIPDDVFAAGNPCRVIKQI